MRFVHSADWQLGKPFARISDPDKRARARQARVEAIGRIGAVAAEHEAGMVLVAGDLFDSPLADKATVSAACSAIGQIGCPVLVIPGNHDHGGPGSTWEQEFFTRERQLLAPNLRVLATPEPYDAEGAVILPCPLRYRTAPRDPTEWLRAGDVYRGLPTHKPRVVLAHGSTQTFSERGDEDEMASPADWVDITRLPRDEIDYIALGDWHGTVAIDDRCWYSGTPEPDRFPKTGDYDSGNVLVVEVERSEAPRVTTIPTGVLRWNEVRHDFVGDDPLEELRERLAGVIEQRVNQDFLRLSLVGSLGMDAADALDRLLESLDARLLRLKLDNQTVLAPTEAEIQALAFSSGDPLIAMVARRLIERLSEGEEGSAVARVALRELHRACDREVRA